MHNLHNWKCLHLRASTRHLLQTLDRRCVGPSRPGGGGGGGGEFTPWLDHHDVFDAARGEPLSIGIPSDQLSRVGSRPAAAERGRPRRNLARAGPRGLGQS